MVCTALSKLFTGATFELLFLLWQAALAFLSPAWAAAFASPPAAMALAMAAAGVGGGDSGIAKSFFVKHEPDTPDRRASRLRSFSSLKLPDSPKAAATPKDKASAKAAALAAARDQERAAKIGSGRGLGAVAMATSVQRRSKADKDRAKRWNLAEAMGSAWQDFSTSVAERERGHFISERDLNVPGIKVLGRMVETAIRMQAEEVSNCENSAETKTFGKYKGSFFDNVFHCNRSKGVAW